MSLDVNSAVGDQATTSVNVSPDQLVAIQIFGREIQNANGISVRFEYDARQVVYGGFDAGKYELVTYNTYFVNSEFTASEFRFKISASERHGKYGFVETKAVAINTELEQLGTLAYLPCDDDRPDQGVEIEDLSDLEIDVRKDIPKTGMQNPQAVAVVIVRY